MLIKELESLEIGNPNENFAILISQINLQNSNCERNEVAFNIVVTLHDPPFMAIKGHP